MKRLIFLLILGLNLTPSVRDHVFYIGAGQVYAQGNVGEEEPPEPQHVCATTESNLMYTWPNGDKAYNECEVFRDCSTNEFVGYGPCEVRMEYTYADPPSSPGIDTPASNQPIDTNVVIINPPSSGNLILVGMKGSIPVAGGGYIPSNAYVLSGNWWVSRADNPIPGMISQVLQVHFTFTVAMPETVDDPFINYPTGDFTVTIFSPTLNSIVGTPQTISMGKLWAGHVINYTTTVTFNPTNISSVVYWRNLPIQMILQGGLTYTLKDGSGTGTVYGGQTFRAMVP